MRFSVNKLVPELVAAAEPTPSGRLPLSSMDRIAAVRVLADTILVFQQGLAPAKAIKAALSRALVPYYPVAGRIFEPRPGEPEVACTGEGVWFVEASVDCNLKDVNNLERPLLLPKEELIPFAPAEVKEEDLIMMMQDVHHPAVSSLDRSGDGVHMRRVRSGHPAEPRSVRRPRSSPVLESSRRDRKRPRSSRRPPSLVQGRHPQSAEAIARSSTTLLRGFQLGELRVRHPLRPHRRSEEPVLEGDGPDVLHLRRGHGHGLAVPDAGDMLRRPRRRSPRLRRQHPPPAAGVAAAGRLLRQLRVPHGNQGESWNHRRFLAGGGDRADTRRQREDIHQVLGLDDGGDCGGGPLPGATGVRDAGGVGLETYGVLRGELRVGRADPCHSVE
nr:PREDICTED: rosmarinate synthase-like isoform X2 [Musa acuminata subsp. malaccensis]